MVSFLFRVLLFSRRSGCNVMRMWLLLKDFGLQRILNVLSLMCMLHKRLESNVSLEVYSFSNDSY